MRSAQEILSICALLWGHGVTVSVAAGGPAQYRNPVIPANLADPSVIRHDGIYYLYGTGEVEGDHGTRVYTSTNLVDWERGPVVFEPGPPHVWAPDVWRDPASGRFYLYYTVSQTVGVADAAGPLGPFTLRRKFFDQAIDAHLFRDSDGKLYLYFVQLPGFRITVQPMASPMEPEGERKVLLQPESEWERRAGHVTEGPWMMKHDGRYYLLYSGSGADTPDYAVGYATADNPTGPFTRAAHNPIIQRSEGVFGPGHGCAVQDPAGQWWHVYHQKLTAQVEWKRFIALDPLWFDSNGDLRSRATRGTWQTAPAQRRFSFFEDAAEAAVHPKPQPPSAAPVFQRDPAVPRRVRVAAGLENLGTTLPGYEPPRDLQGFSDAELAMPRRLIEYVLDIGHALQLDFCNHDVDPQAGLDQVVFNQPKFGGAASLWFTRPMSLCANPAYLSDPSGISSLFHEIGHNLTLNTPARYRFGGKTDGPMSTIVSETLAQIMQHATAYELLNQPAPYGLPPETLEAIRGSALQSFAVTARAHRDYAAQGCPYATVQSDEPGKPDRTFGTFMTVAFEFVKRADERGDCRLPLQRMMALLQTFCAEDHRRFQVREDESFRGTLMVAALSHAFGEDLRPVFRRLNFPADDAIHGELLARMPKVQNPTPAR